MRRVGSRYASVEVNNYLSRLGENVGMLSSRNTTVLGVTQIETYIVSAGDTLETIAYKRLGNARLWWVLADMNPHIFWPLSLVSGDKLLIPSKVQAILS